MASSPGNLTTISQRVLGFLIDADDVLQCEVCLEPFDSEKRPPKLLPCGHNFCENCLFNLCCHQQYCFLDFICCPTCRQQFDSKTAIKAPTNYDLCKMLESVKRGQDLNVTIIHVADKSCNSPSSKVNIAVSSSTPPLRRDSKRKRNQAFINDDSENVLEKRKVENINRCSDCKRKITGNNRCRLSRFCQQCYGNDKILHLSCIECCVNKHNGHHLRPVDELEYEHQRLLNEIRELGPRRQEISSRFDGGLQELETMSNINLDFCSLKRAKQTLMKESDKSFEKAVERLENRFFTPLPPVVISKIRHRQLQNFARLKKMLTLLEKCQQNMQTRLDRHMNLLSKSLPKSVSTNSHRSISTIKADESATYSSLSTVLALATDDNAGYAVIKKNLPLIVDENLTELCKINALKHCVQVLDGIISAIQLPEILLLFQDAYLNCFHSLHFLSKRIAKDQIIERKEIWVYVQRSMTELLKISSQHFPNYNADRVDIVADIAFLCDLFSDVCDTAMITVCVIEAARSRVTIDQTENECEKKRILVQLELIDEHLFECQRVQKLRELRSSTKTKNVGRCSRLRKWLKSSWGTQNISAK
uniref:RING-type domain-containing protein n=1 Tax=Panagrolaimus sp. JU765 TaxID=591449 RepID=A0AC34Q1Q7_9BILA